MSMKPKPLFFATPAAMRTWLSTHHDTAGELWVGFFKRSSGKPSITWPESVDQALCFGWIDGIRKSIDDISYVIRFTPRRPRSTWSAVNTRRVAELTALGLMQPAGLKAFRERAPARSGIYAYEQRHAARLEPAQQRRFRANKKAWEYFQAQPPSYRQTAIWWVVTAKRDETRVRRLATLIEASGAGRPIPPLLPRVPR
ncbi:MAG: YdeI/OmpD-associated family protein [bacterium]